MLSCVLPLVVADCLDVKYHRNPVYRIEQKVVGGDALRIIWLYAC